jgi:PIN domain nuclease of toxin-antitoxin system
VERNEVTYLDTHIVVWLYDGEVSKLTKAAIDQIQEDELFVSPAVVLELQLLHEIKRVRPTAMRIMDQLSTDVGVSLCQLSFAVVVEHALDEKWVRDPFDRLIVAHAAANEAPLITKDEKIRRHYRRSIW